MALVAPQLPNLATRTGFHAGHSFSRDQVPEPTLKPSRSHSLDQRQIELESSFTSVCGYIDGNISYPISCESAYCGFHYIFSAVGCCATYQTTSSSQVILDSCVYPIACLNAADLEGYCDKTCQSNDMILKCTETPSTWCNTFTYPPYSYSGFACGTEYNVYTVQQGTTTPGVTSYPPWVSTTYSAAVVPFASATSGPSTMTKALPPLPASTGQLGRHVGEIAAAVVATVFACILLIAVAMFFYLRKRSRPQGALRADATPEYGQPLIQRHQNHHASPH